VKLKLNKRGLLPSLVAVFRVDAGPGIGMGHFMRCRTIALEMIKRGWFVYFVGWGLPEELMSYSSVNSPISWIEFKPSHETNEDMKRFLEILRTRFSFNVNFVIFDSYRFKRDDYAFLQLFGQRIPVAIIDDMAQQDTPAQVVINPNPLFSPEPYQRQKIPRILCGEQYTLIRPEVVALRDRAYDSAGPVLITLGGGDVVEPLMKVLDAMPEHLGRKIVVSVSQNCPMNEIQNWISNDPENRYVNTDSEKFPELLASASVAITGGGGTLWEVYCLGIPGLSIVWVDNQKHTSTIIKDQATSFLVDLISHINIEMQSEMLETGLQKIVETLGPPGSTRIVHEKGFRTSDVISREKTSLVVDNVEAIDKKFIRKAISRLTSDFGFPQGMMRKQRQLIDGMGAQRVVTALEEQKWEQVPLFGADYRRNYEDW
jgi:spore coat polysaccharide biosynthesis predicted glycosyltransferase SpsG